MSVNLDYYKKYEIDFEKVREVITESIVAIYGEKYRTVIEERLNTVYVNSYTTYQNLKCEYSLRRNQKIAEINMQILEDIGIEVSQEVQESVYTEQSPKYDINQRKALMGILGSSSGLNEKNYIFYFDDRALEESREEAVEKRCKVFQFLGHNIFSDQYEEFIKTAEGKEALAKAKLIHSICLKGLNELHQFEETYKEVTDFIEECEREVEKINLKYAEKYYEEIAKFLPDDEKKRIEEVLAQKDYKDYSSFRRKIDPNEYYYTYGNIVDYFSEKYDEGIKQNERGALVAKNKRIKYFKSKGLDLGDEYSSYEQSEEAKKLRPSEEFIKKIDSIKMNIEMQKQDEIIEGTSNYRTCRENLENLGLCAEDGFDHEFVIKNGKAVVPNVVMDENGNYRNLNVLNINILGCQKGSKDVTLIHELLHIVELTMKRISENEFDVKTGLDGFKIKLKDEKEQEQEQTGEKNAYRKYEMLSENLHQQLSVLVTNHLHEKGIFLYDKPEDTRVKYSICDYDRFDCITNQIMSQVKEDIIYGMMTPDIKNFLYRIGTENLNSINDIVTEYIRIPYYQLKASLDNREENSLTQKRAELINNAKGIASNMKECSKKKHQITLVEVENITKDVRTSEIREAYATIIEQEKELNKSENVTER